MIKTIAYTTLLLIAIAATPAAQADSCKENSGSGSIGPIPKAWADAFNAVRADPKPDKLTKDSHFFVSDEQRHDLFRQDVKNLGGVFIGLGTDQNYLMAAWARPEVLVPLDFDQMVVNLHFAFRVIFLNAKTKEEARKLLEYLGLPFRKK